MCSSKLLVIDQPDERIKYAHFISESSTWTVENLTELLIEVHHVKDVSDVFLEHGYFVKVRHKSDMIFVKVGPKDLGGRSMAVVGEDVLNAFFKDCMSRACEVTRTRRNATSKLMVSRKNSKIGERFTFRLEGLRHSMSHLSEAAYFVLRPLRKVPELSKLGVHPKAKEVIRIKDKIVVVNGPTGSGKSTLISSLLVEIVSHAREHILTSEDPVEYDMEIESKIIGTIRQFDANEDILTENEYESGMPDLGKSFLRMRPDRVFIGEIRDAQSVQVATRIARSAHQVFTTTHCNRCWDVFERFIDMVPSDAKISSFVELISYMGAIVSQKLIESKSHGMLPLEDVIFFEPRDVTELIEAVRKSFMSSGEYSGFTSEFKRIFREKVERDEAVSMTSHLKEHYDNGFLTEEEYSSHLMRLDIL